MSFFDKLSIQGIRCFGPDEGDRGIIKFSLPLTLILGNNGCGKTTIIEALKYSTCGELPPGSSGSNKLNFVHDPKLTCGPEVKGQVRLQVRNVSGKCLSIVRTVQATMRANKGQFKSVDQVINCQDEDGKWKSIGGRCADADTEMCLALGVSKAVLSNVLLCHQEESNWPLDEDLKVKVRFDEIFGCDKYNKCLDELKAVSKKLTEDEGKLKIELRNLETNKNDASVMRTRLEDANLRLLKYESQLTKFEAQLNPIQTQLKELALREDKISQLRTTLETHKAKLEGVRAAMKDLNISIQHQFRGSVEELKVAIDNFGQELNSKQESLEMLENQSEIIGRGLDKNQESLSTEQTRLGQLNSDLDAHKRRIDRRGQSVLMLSEELSVTASVSQLSQADEFHRIWSEIEGALLAKETEISIKKDKHREKLTAMQKETSDLREERAKIDTGVNNKKEQLNINKDELKKVNGSIFEADQSAKLLGKLQIQQDQIKKEYDELMKNEDFGVLRDEITSTKKERDRLDDEMLRIEKEVADLQLMSQVQAELTLQKTAKTAKDAEIQKLKSRHEDTLKELLQLNELPDQGIRFQLEGRIDQFSDTVKTKSEELRKIDKELVTKETEHKHIAQKIKDAKKLLNADEFAINQACGGEDYDTYTAELSKKLGDLQDDKGTLSSAEHFFRRYVQTLQKQDPCCPLCKRDFSTEDEVTKLISELTMKVREVPSKLRQNKEELDQVQEKYEKLLQLKSKHEKVGVLRTLEIPELENSLERSNREVANLKNRRSDIQDELDGPQTLEVMAKSIHSDVCLLEQHLIESRRLAKELIKIEDKLSAGTGSKKSLQEAVDEQKTTRCLLQQSKRTVDQLETKLRNLENKKMQLQEEKHRIQDQQFKISGNAQRRAQLSERKEELEIIEGTLQAEINNLVEQSVAISRQIEHSERKTKNLQASNSAEIDELNKKLREIQKRYEDIEQLNRQILEYEMSDGLKKLETCKKAIEELHVVRDGLKQEKESICDRCDKIKMEIATHRTRERDLQDNLKLRHKMAEESELAVKVDELNLKIDGMDCSSIYEKRLRLKREESDLFNEKAEAEGRIVELRKSITSIEEDLNKPHLKFAEVNYCDASVHFEVIAQSKKDLDAYYRALNSAMMAYHKKKIKHINTVINELWRKVYSGNDIDGIKIYADDDAKTTAQKRAAYKYRVIQTKCGSEIGMRGRCSAGQKVLACLIIRIALAETFSSHCGVLALDEPTTNLDQENIINLSRVLQSLVRLQAKRKNFQLIVITHDHEFLKELTGLGTLDHFIKLDRNVEGKSIVTKVSL